ncbi:MAG TPA: dTDP-glucose 4,6-dehydratase [Gemmatimonadales bacterium]|nr:dTDP-glucose 4,6-dehydratase [Gemmatimonadales bacterium]
MRSLLVTGGAGFIGSNFVHYWLDAHPGDRVVVLDALTYAGNPASLEAARTRAEFRFVHGDIRDAERVAALLRQHEITTVVHFAAESHVDRSIYGPDAFVDTNVNGTHALLKAARDVWLSRGRPAGDVRFHHISTDEVYGSLAPTDPPFTETSPYAPNSPYAASKAAADHLVRAYHHTYGLPVTTSNCSNNYGPYQFPEKLISLMLVNLLDGKALPVYGDGRNVRDWLYVEDHCRAIDRVLEAGQVGQTYNVGGRNEWMNIDVVRLLCRLVDDAFAADRDLARRFPASPAASGGRSEELVTYVKDRPGHDRRYAIDATRIERDLGFCPRETFETGIRRTLDWYLANEPWWRGVMDGSYRQWVQRHYGEGGDPARRTRARTPG